VSVIKVLVTGAYGLIGGAVYAHLAAHPGLYEPYGLARRRQPSDRTPKGGIAEIPEERFVLSDLSDLGSLVESMRGIDVVVHMAADPRMDAPWESLLASNVVGGRNVLEAARLSGVGRVIVASSAMVSWGYWQDEPYRSLYEGRYEDLSPQDVQPVTHEWPLRPTTAYAATKIWMEGLGRTYAEAHGLSVLCLRIGWVNAEDRPHTYPWARAGWCSQRDIAQMVERSILAPAEVGYDVFYALSNGKWNWVDIDHARVVLGYTPQNSAEERWEGP
jgi:nucleoside-diphosphate-sugar epimerase